MIDIDTIMIHEGINGIRFGMPRNDVLSKINSEHIEETDTEGDIDIIYQKLNLIFTFWKDYEFKLGSIQSERKDSILLGSKLIGSTKEQIKSFIYNELDSEITEEDGCEHEDGHIQEWLEADDKSLSFWFTNNSLYQICWTCAWADNDTPKW